MSTRVCLVFLVRSLTAGMAQTADPAHSSSEAGEQARMPRCLSSSLSARYRPYRKLFETLFWHEGDALWCEMLFWDKGFDRTPEERVGALVRRMHRSARIIFTMNFHHNCYRPKRASNAKRPVAPDPGERGRTTAGLTDRSRSKRSCSAEMTTTLERIGWERAVVGLSESRLIGFMGRLDANRLKLVRRRAGTRFTISPTRFPSFELIVAVGSE